MHDSHLQFYAVSYTSNMKRLKSTLFIKNKFINIKFDNI